MKYTHTNLITAEPLITEVKQELKSYFEAGAVSEILLPTFIDQALRKLKVLVYQPEEAVLSFVNFKSELPPDFAILDYALIYNSEVLWSPGVNSMIGYWYKGIDCIESIDTSNPIMAALEETKYTDAGLFEKPKANMNSHFKINIKDINLDILKHNIKSFKKINNFF